MNSKFLFTTKGTNKDSLTKSLIIAAICVIIGLIVISFTKGREYDIVISKDYLSKEDKVLIIDDFLADGNAAKGLIGIVEASGADVVGIGIVIEKGFQPGGALLRGIGIRVESLAIIDSIDGNTITFR